MAGFRHSAFYAQWKESWNLLKAAQWKESATRLTALDARAHNMLTDDGDEEPPNKRLKATHLHNPNEPIAEEVKGDMAIATKEVVHSCDCGLEDGCPDGDHGNTQVLSWQFYDTNRPLKPEDLWDQWN
jgi:hypothetical protein